MQENKSTHLQTLFGSMPIVDAKPKARSVCGCYVSECYCEKQKNIERHFLAGKSLTVLDCLKLYRTVELRKFICVLKKNGHNIVGEWVQNGKATYKTYKLIKDGN